jgi:peptidoglycan/LPS O-acetylase OafA/YrhL
MQVDSRHVETPASYRPDIDGLRAIAVIAVVLYHLGVPGMRGGFVGVDVFFVISGYLITRLVRREMAAGEFTFRNFFVRRVRRLAAPLLLVALAALVVGYLVSAPNALHSISQSVQSQPLALQNLHFLAEGDYFQLAESKPLLHTWSLGVEEQFYLLWPLLLFLLRRRLRTTVIWIAAASMAVSFAANLVLLEFIPKAAFYLLPARAWELGFGGILALSHEPTKQVARRRRVGVVPALAAIGLLIVAFVRIDPEGAFPGWAAILPVAATTILIAHGTTSDSAVKRALSAPALVYVGLISYSLYLWHWPVITFAKGLGASPSHPVTAMGLIGLSVGLATLTYHFVERPIRQRRVLGSPQRLVMVAGAVALALFGAATAVRLTRGAAFRYPEPARSMLTASFEAENGRCNLGFRLLHPTAHVCDIYSAPDPTGGVLLWGNSHADMWSGLFRDLGERYDKSVSLNVRNCRPVTDNDDCGVRVQSSILGFVEEHAIADVVLASTWYQAAVKRPEAEFEAELRAVVQQLTDRGARVWIVVDTPSSPLLDPLLRYEANPDLPTFVPLPISTYQPVRQKQLDFFQTISDPAADVYIIDVTDTLCFEGFCYGGMGNTPWYFDGNHLTNAATSRAEAAFSPVFTVEEQAG